MRIAHVSVRGCFCSAALLVFLCGLLIPPMPVSAQTCSPPSATGFNVVYGSYCGGSATFQGAFAMVDAAQFGTSTDICAAIATIFSTYNPSTSNGVVIDARGFSSASLICHNGGSNPWSTLTGTFSSTVLLPAGTITLYETLSLPSHTKLVGEGSGLTTLIAASGLTGDMIDMGFAASCPGPENDSVVIEHLALNGNNILGLNGIVNYCSQELSYVDDVALTNFGSGGTGLWLNDRSDDSGPYTNISYSGSGICAQLFNAPSASGGNLNQTRGIHGLSCIMGGSASTPAIYLDAPNNSLEDIYITSTSSLQDGILVGSQANTSNNVLFNVQGSGLANVIHISTLHTVNDLSILGLTCTGSGGGGACPGNSINDLVTGTTLTDPNVGMYIIGEPVTGSGSTVGHSRFTTSVNHTSSAGAVSWLVGPQAPLGNCAAGSLYSCTDAHNCNTLSLPYTLWECTGGSAWKHIQ